MKLKSHVLPDASFKDLLRIDSIFADVINVTLFCGHQVINPSCLSYLDTELSQNIQYNDDVLSVIRRSDLMKRYTSSHMNIPFGIEIQSVPDKNMPERIAGYTYLSYLILDKNKEKKIPVIMIIFYAGERKWKEGKIKMCEAIRELRYKERMKGINEGQIKGREEGESKKQIEIAIEMKKDERFSNEDIQRFTGLSIEQLAML